MKKKKAKPALTRRDFLKGSTFVTAGAFLAPTIVPATVFDPNAPSERITIGVIGTGRIARTMDIPEMLGLDGTQIVAVCDVDSKRVKDAKAQVDQHYSKKYGTADAKGCGTFGDFRELLARDDIDAVMICTPDHWHSIPAIAAARAGKDIFIQKPLSLTISGGRAVSDTVREEGRILQIGSQQRSPPKFRQACELVRNGRIGKLHTIKVGLPGDPGGQDEPEMPVPPNLDFDMWRGCTRVVAYTEKGVHPQKDYSRPGWLRIGTYGAGMITGWGSHHLDTAQWGMGTEHTGPISVEGEAEFPKSGLWNVHGDFRIEYTYKSGVKVIAADNKRNAQGVRFEGSEGWIHVKRWSIDGSPKSILTSKIGDDEIHLYKSDNHKKDFIDCVKSRSQPVAPVEVGHRSCTVCLLGQIAMKAGRKLEWDPDKERFVDDDAANKLLTRPMRAPWKI